jgi:ATP/ADP translocase/HEAT repeat protein
MLKLLNRALNINRDEWPRLAYLGGFIFAFVLGINWAQIVILAAFTAQVGPELVPYLFIGDAIAVTLAIIVYSAFVDRYSHERVMVWMIGLGLAGIIIGTIILQLGEIRLGYIYFYLLFRILFDVLSVHAGTYRSTFFDTQSAKRAYPVLFSILRVAVIVAGFSIPLLNGILRTEAIILLWGATMIVMALLIVNRKRWIKTLPGAGDGKSQPEKRPSYWENTRDGFRFVVRSPYLRVMALASFASTVTLTLLTFQTLRIFRTTLPNVTEIANYTGTLTGIGGLIILPIQLFIFSRIVSRVGVGNASLIFPIILVFVSGVVIAFPSQLGSGGLAYFTNNTIKIAIYGIINELLYNAVPVKVRGRSRAFVNGVVVPFGTLIGGIIILLPITNQSWFLPVLLGGFTVVMALSAFLLRANYAQALVQMLEQEDFGMFSKETSRYLEAANSVNLADKETVNFLKNKIYESKDTSESLLTAQLLTEAMGRDAVPALETLIREGTPEVRSGLLTVFAENDIRSELAQKMYAAALEDPDPQVQKAALTGLERSRALANPDYLKLAIAILPDAPKDMQAQILPFMLNDAKYRPEAEVIIQNLLESQHAEDRVAGVQLLGKSGAGQVPALVKYLSDPADVVRLAALTTLDAVMTVSQRSTFAAAIGARTADESERVRLASIRILKGIEGAGTIPPLLACLNDATNLVRSEATQAIIGKGKEAIPAVRTLLTAPSPQQRQAATYILASIQSDEYRGLILGRIDELLTEIYRNIARLHSAKELIKAKLFEDVILERNRALTEDLFQMLGTLYDAEGIAVIRDALRDESTSARANAAEALEAIVTPKSGKLIAGLLNPSAWVNDLILAGQLELGIEVYSPKKAIESLLKERGDYWLRAVTVFMLGELGAALNPNHPPPLSSTAKTERHRRGSALLDALVDQSKSEDPKDKKDDAATQKTQEARKTPTNRPNMERLANLLSNQNASDTLPLGAFTLEEIRRLVSIIANDTVEDVRTAAEAARRIIDKKDLLQLSREEGHVLSAIEKIIFLRGVPFFQNMTVNQLKVLAAVCEERNFSESKVIIAEGEQTGVLYVVVRGRVGIEKLNKSTRTSARLSTVEARSHFGEDTLFDNGASPTSAIALEDTLALILRHEPLVALMQDNPELSLQLIKVLSQRLRETGEQVASLTRNMSRSMHQVYDKLG